jgi:hypothetical protein
MTTCDKRTLRELMIDCTSPVGAGPNTEAGPLDRAALADLLEEAGRGGEAALVRSGAPLTTEWVHQDYYLWHRGEAELSDGRLREMQALPWADHLRLVPYPVKPAPEGGSRFALFADE